MRREDSAAGNAFLLASACLVGGIIFSGIYMYKGMNRVLDEQKPMYVQKSQEANIFLDNSFPTNSSLEYLLTYSKK